MIATVVKLTSVATVVLAKGANVASVRPAAVVFSSTEAVEATGVVVSLPSV